MKERIMEITEEMTILEILEFDRYTIPIFLKHGLNCLGCSLSSVETLGEACEAHGLSLENLLQDLNQHFNGE